MRMQDAVMKLLIHQPFYGALAAATSIIESHTVSKLKMTLVPSPVLEYNREWYVSLPDNQALGVLLHELMHLLLLHALRRGARDPQLWAVACDLAVNQHIPPDMLPPDAATLEKVERRIEYLLPRARSAEVYYDEMARLLDDGFSLIQREGEVVSMRQVASSPWKCRPRSKSPRSPRRHSSARWIRAWTRRARAAKSPRRWVG